MAILSLVYHPNPILRQRSEEVTIIDDNVRRLVDDMIETMYYCEGAGLAAVQVGHLKRIMILDVGKKEADKDESDLKVFINPEIIEFSEEEIVFPEGCLSFPGSYLDISRPRKVKVKFLDLDENETILEADDWLSRGIQHELDHLDGKVLTEYVSRLKSNLFIKKVDKHKKNNGLK